MGVDLEAIRRRVAELQTGKKSTVQLFKPNPGTYVVRALPWPAKYLSDGCVMVERYLYYLAGGRPTLAPHQFGKPDPINDFINKLWRGSDEDKAVAKKLRPKMQTYLPIVVKKGEGSDPEKVIVWSINRQMYQKMLNWFLNEDIGDYLDVNTGFDITITVTDGGRLWMGKKMFDLDADLARKQSPAAPTPEAIKKLLDNIPDIDSMYETKTPAELEQSLKEWLDGGVADPGTTGTEKTPAKSDVLDDIVNDVKGKSKPVDDDKSTKKSKSKKDVDADAEDDDSTPAKKQTLDEAFDELLNDEE